MSEYAKLSRAALEKRLAAAENVCLMYGWCPMLGRDATDREKAANVLWARWLNVVGRDILGPDAYPHLNDDAVAEMATEFDSRREHARQGGKN